MSLFLAWLHVHVPLYHSSHKSGAYMLATTMVGSGTASYSYEQNDKEPVY